MTKYRLLSNIPEKTLSSSFSSFLAFIELTTCKKTKILKKIVK